MLKYTFDREKTNEKCPRQVDMSILSNITDFVNSPWTSHEQTYCFICTFTCLQNTHFNV